MSNDNHKAKMTQNAIGTESPPREMTHKPKMEEEDEFGNAKYLPARSNLKFDEQEEMIGAFKEQLRLEKELDEAKFRLAAQQDFNLMDAF